MAKNVDDTDMAILHALSKNARASYREIAAEVGVAVGTVQNRLQKMEKEGILEGFMPMINYNKLGYGVDAIIALVTPREKTDELARMLLKNKHVKSIYQTTGDVDLFIRVEFRTNQELYDFLMKELTDRYVKSSVTYTVLDKKRNHGKLLK